MSEVINSIFGRPKNETPGYGYGDPNPAATDTPEVATTEPATEETDSAPEDASAEEIVAAEPADSDDDTEDTAEAADAEIVDEPVVVTAESDEEAVDEAGPIVAEEAVAEEAAAEPAEPAEPVMAETRPTAGTRGSTTVADGVVTKIVTMVTRKAEGVYELDEAGISVDVDGDTATIAVTLVVEFGRSVKTVAEQIRIKVIEAVEQYLGLDVALVDVHVADIHFPDLD